MDELGSGAVKVIEGYQPRTIPAPAAVFARRVVTQAAPATAAQAKAWLFAAGRAGAFALSVGLALDAEVVLSTAAIERFVAATALSGPTRRTVRSRLVSLSAAVLRGPRPARLGRERAKAPYTEAEIAAYLGVADAQPTDERRMRAAGLITLGAGAGLVGADLRAVRGADIKARSGGVVVEVTSGRRPRVVPIRACFHARALSTAGFFGERLVVGGVEVHRRNVTTPLIASLAGGADLPRLQLPRLRSTWLGAVAADMGLRAFLDAAGVVCSQRLGDVAAGLPPVPEADAVALLGAASP